MGIVNKDQALYLATGMDASGKWQIAFESSGSANNKALQQVMMQYKAFLDKIKEVNESVNSEIAALQASVQTAVTDEERQKLQASIGMLEIMRNRSIPGIADEMNKASMDWGKLFAMVGDFAEGSVDGIVQKLQGEIEALKQAGKLTQQGYSALTKELFPPQDTEHYFVTFGKEIGNIFRNIIPGIENAKVKWEDLGETAGKSLADVSTAMAGIGNVGKAIGWAPETQATFSQISSTIGGAANLAKGLASGDITSIISGGTQMIAGMINLFDFSTKRADKAIKEHAQNIKGLQREYEALGWQVKNALGNDYYAMQVDQAENKAKQIQEIEGQIAAEQSKRRKKQDDEKVKEYEMQKVKLEQDIQDIQKNIVNDLMTTDVKSLASKIAAAIVDGVASGVDDLDGVVDKQMDQLMRNILKKQFEVNVVQKALAPMFDKAAQYFSEGSESGFGLSKSELNGLVEAGQKGKENILQGVAGYQQMLAQLDLSTDGVSALSAANGVTGHLQEAMTEGTASQLVGLWNMTANDIRSMRNLTTEQLNLCTMMNLNVGEVLRQQYFIEINTRQTAGNTAMAVTELKGGFERLDSRLKTIDENTKGYTGRGK